MLWILWLLLSLLILNEKIELFKLPEIMTYVTAISLALVHGYNLKYCQCNSEKEQMRNDFFKIVGHK